MIHLRAGLFKEKVTNRKVENLFKTANCSEVGGSVLFCHLSQAQACLRSYNNHRNTPLEGDRELQNGKIVVRAGHLRRHGLAADDLEECVALEMVAYPRLNFEHIMIPA